MTTLANTQKAADALPAREKQQLLLFVAASLRAESGEVPRPREFSREQIAAWVTEDELDLK